MKAALATTLTNSRRLRLDWRANRCETEKIATGIGASAAYHRLGAATLPAAASRACQKSRLCSRVFARLALRQRLIGRFLADKTEYHSNPDIRIVFAHAVNQSPHGIPFRRYRDRAERTRARSTVRLPTSVSAPHLPVQDIFERPSAEPAPAFFRPSEELRSACQANDQSAQNNTT